MITPEEVEFSLIKHFEQETKEPKIRLTDFGAEYEGILGTYRISREGEVTLRRKES